MRATPPEADREQRKQTPDPAQEGSAYRRIALKCGAMWACRHYQVAIPWKERTMEAPRSHRRLRNFTRTVSYTLLRGAASALGALAVHIAWQWLIR